jgi:hypothetical protein
MSAPKKSKNYYVNPESFRLALIESNVNGELTPACVAMLMKMVDKIQLSFKYVDPQDKEDCHSAALEVVLTKWKKYDCSRDNPFAYFTRIIYNGLYAGWNQLAKGRAEHSLSQVFTEDV